MGRFNAAKEEQAQARVFRNGQKQKCEFIRILAKNTIDEDLHKLQERKLRDIGGVYGSSDLMGDLTLADLQGMIRARLPKTALPGLRKIGDVDEEDEHYEEFDDEEPSDGGSDTLRRAGYESTDESSDDFSDNDDLEDDDEGHSQVHVKEESEEPDQITGESIENSSMKADKPPTD